MNISSTMRYYSFCVIVKYGTLNYAREHSAYLVNGVNMTFDMTNAKRS